MSMAISTGFPISSYLGHNTQHRK